MNLEIGLINNCISKNLYSHVVGHGLTIRGNYITSINGFNSKFWCEDIYLTGLLHNNHEKILSLNSLDNAENPNNLKIQIIQNAVWFKTAAHHLLILKDIVNYILNLLAVNFKRFKVYIKDYFSTCLSILFTGLGPLYSLFLKEKVKTER